MQQKYSHV